jgi:hypothetical protein
VGNAEGGQSGCFHRSPPAACAAENVRPDLCSAPIAFNSLISNTFQIPDPIAGSLLTMAGPVYSPNPLKTNETEKRRNHRQKSSFIVKTGFNPLNLLNNQ